MGSYFSTQNIETENENIVEEEPPKLNFVHKTSLEKFKRSLRERKKIEKCDKEGTFENFKKISLERKENPNSKRVKEELSKKVENCKNEDFIEELKKKISISRDRLKEIPEEMFKPNHKSNSDFTSDFEIQLQKQKKDLKSHKKVEFQTKEERKDIKNINEDMDIEILSFYKI